jgi:acyl-CoA synthetase (NDP forming)
MATDACVARGLRMAALGARTQRELRSFLPAEASVANPVDMIASAPAAAYARALPLLLADEAVDAVVVLFVPPLVTGAAAVAEAIREGAAGSAKPVVTCFMGAHGVPEALSSLRHGKLPSYRFPEAAAIALGRAARYGAWLRRAEGSVPELPGVDPARARALLAAAPPAPPAGRWLEADEARELLAAYGIRSPRARTARSAGEAAAAAASLGFPVAVKLLSSRLTHKTDVGGVVLGVNDAAGVAAAWDAIRSRVAEAGHADGMEGVQVQEMAPRGVEAFVGLTHDPAYGPLIGFGLGGVHVEVWRDVVFRLAPITDVDAAEMLDQVRGARLLDGFRGAPAADRAALTDALLRISRMTSDLPELLELDLNPLLALAPRGGVMALDARIRVGAAGAR